MKYVLVSGAYGGMGKAVVSKLVKVGYTVFALDKIVEKATNQVYPLQVDVTDIESLKKAYDEISKITDNLYAIVHLAGVYYLDSLIEIPEEKFIRAFDINCFGVYRINKTFLPLLKKGSKIVITSSELAPLDPLPFTGLYAITKSTIVKYAYSLRMELQLLGIKVSVLRPGAVKTNLLNDSVSELDKFCEKTELYQCNATRFNKIVNSVESKNITAEKLSKKLYKIIKAKRVKFVYKINRNPLLLILNALPDRMQTWIIKKILK